MIYIHEVNMEITSLHSIEPIVAVDSFMIHTCKRATAMKREAGDNYKDPVSGQSKTTECWSYGRKYYMTIDINSLLIME